MPEPRYKYFVWETELVLTSATVGEQFVCGLPIDIGDWRSLVVQFDVTHAVGGLATGDFQCRLESCLALGDYEYWSGSNWLNLPGATGASVDFDPGAEGATLQKWLRWQVRHNVAVSQWIRLQVKVFLKQRESAVGRAPEVIAALAAAAAALSAGGLTARDLVVLSLARAA